MKYVPEKRPLQSAVITIQDGKNAIARLQRQVTQLEERLVNYFHRLDELEMFCKRTQDKFETTQQRIRKAEYEIIQKQAARKSEHSAVLKINLSVKAATSLDENDLDVQGSAAQYTV